MGIVSALIPVSTLGASSIVANSLEVTSRSDEMEMAPSIIPVDIPNVTWIHPRLRYLDSPNVIIRSVVAG